MLKLKWNKALILYKNNIQYGKRLISCGMTRALILYKNNIQLKEEKKC